jgi:hypothetical protein
MIKDHVLSHRIDLETKTPDRHAAVAAIHPCPILYDGPSMN